MTSIPRNNCCNILKTSVLTLTKLPLKLIINTLKNKKEPQNCLSLPVFTMLVLM